MAPFEGTTEPLERSRFPRRGGRGSLSEDWFLQASPADKGALIQDSALLYLQQRGSTLSAARRRLLEQVAETGNWQFLYRSPRNVMDEIQVKVGSDEAEIRREWFRYQRERDRLFDLMKQVSHRFPRIELEQFAPFWARRREGPASPLLRQLEPSFYWITGETYFGVWDDFRMGWARARSWIL